MFCMHMAHPHVLDTNDISNSSARDQVVDKQFPGSLFDRRRIDLAEARAVQEGMVYYYPSF